MFRRRSSTSSSFRFSWGVLIFEILVVVAGVTIALGAGELRQRFGERAQVRGALQGIAAEMQFNCERLTRAQAYHERLLAEIDSLQAARPDLARAEAAFGMLSSWNGYNPAFTTAAAYETAQATGALALMPYEQALVLGRYYTFVDLYRDMVSRGLGTVLETEAPSLDRVRLIVQITNELQRELAPQSCAGAEQLQAELEPAA